MTKLLQIPNQVRDDGLLLRDDVFFVSKWRAFGLGEQRVAYKDAAGTGGACGARCASNGGGSRNPGSATHGAQGLLLQNICITKKVPQEE